MPPGPQVLLIRLSSLGDVVLATSALEALTEDLPEAAVDVLTKPEFREVFRLNPGLRRTVDWQPSAGLGALARTLRSARYDWIADLHGNLRTTLLRFLVAGPRWVRYPKGILRRRLGVWLRRPELLGEEHVVDRYRRALLPLGVRNLRRMPRIYLDARERESAFGLLRGAGWDGEAPLIALAPGARWASKGWPARGWRDLTGRIRAEGLGFPVLLGGAGEAELCREISDAAGSGNANLAGKTPIRETCAVLEAASALVTNDSAPLHLATAVKTPAVALFGPTVRGFGFYPLGPADALLERDLSCRPCALHGGDACPEGHHRCLEEIEPGHVLTELRRILALRGDALAAAGAGILEKGAP